MPRQVAAGPSRPKQPVAAQSPPPPPSASAFNSSRTHFALAQPVLGSADKVTVWDVAADQVVSEWEVPAAGSVSTLVWASIASGSQGKKKRRKRDQSDGEEVVLILTDSETLVIYSPSRGQVVRTVQLPSNVIAAWSDESSLLLATASSLLVLSADLTSVSNTFSLPAGTAAPTSVAILPSSTSTVLHVLVASSSIITLHLDLSSSKSTYTSSPVPVSTSSVTCLHPLPHSAIPSHSESASFLVASDDDRSVSQYTLQTPTSPAKLSYRYASPTLSPVHSLASSPTLVSVLHHSGEVSLFPLPTQLDFARPKSDSKPSSVKLVEGKTDQLSRLCRVEFASNDQDGPGALLCGRMAGAGRVKWYRAQYELPEGGVRAATTVKCEAQDLVAKSSNGPSSGLQRFAAPATVADAPEMDTTADEAASALPTDVDMADLSLGERLLALPNGDSLPNGDVQKPKAASAPQLDGPVNAASLTRLLVQALHTSDPALLTLCLSHRDPVLIRNTIRKMPAQMALPLLKACVERLGQGKRSNKRGGGRGGAQSEQHARGTVEWVKGVLVERGSVLMTMPSLPFHLASLSQLLQTRLQLYQPLLSLSGRLDLALAQIQMRQIAAVGANAEGGGRKGGEGERYVEGESEDEDEVPIEVGDGDGEIEDVDMRAGESDDDDVDDDSEDDDGDEEGENGEDDDDEDLLESGSEDGLLDLEAEEGSEDEETASEEED